MSLFHYEDLVEFKFDPTITGVVYMTWSEIENSCFVAVKDLYVHSSTPSHILRTWRKEGRLLTGYLIVEFMLPGDGFCLVQEGSLRLRDRSVFLGDIVKRNASDHQSGRVISVSAECTIEPVCSMEEYARACPNASKMDQGRTPSSQGNPRFEVAKNLASCQNSKLVVPAGDLRDYQDFWEGDHVIYQNSIGLVTMVSHEVAVRLTNGSVVVVEEASELEIPLYVPGSSSHALAHRLDLAGYQRNYRKFQTTYALDGSQGRHAAWIFPGQLVQTKKGNLRRGKWKFGAYDPNVEPRGLVVDVRTVGLQLEILFPDRAGENRVLGPLPSVTLSVDDLERGKVKLIDPNRLPSTPLAKALVGATTEVDKEYGQPVRLRDAAAASLKTAGKVCLIPRTETQGYDMNVFHVSSTQSKALVCWQDGSCSEERTTSLVILAEMDLNDVWPGDKVSLKTDERTLHLETSEEDSQLHARTVGVVQTVNAVERLAKVRWFENADIKIHPTDDNIKQAGHTPLDYGTISDRTTEVSLYEISHYDALEPNLGDLALSLPTCASSSPQVNDPWGEVVELCLDGDVILRCYGKDEPYVIKVESSNMMVIPDAEMEEDWDGSDGTRSDTEEEELPEPIEVRFEYQGGNRMDVDGDEDAWSTEDDSFGSGNTSRAPSQENDNAIDLRLQDDHAKTKLVIKGHNKADTDELGNAQNVAPTTFHILAENPPRDHHYLGDQSASAANVAKAITKQYRILQTSLPEGIFVRTWESRLDLLQVLIIGPIGTPYEHAPFLFDMYLPASFPDDPPMVYFHSWDNYLGRMNPNLYEDGKVCLSLLGTWPADEKSQGWSKKSTILQVLVSITGLILVKEPYFNEAGYEVLVGSDASNVASRIYSERVFIMAKAFVIRTLSSPPEAFQDVVEWIYCSPSGPRFLHRIVHDYQVSSTGLVKAFTSLASGDDQLLDKAQGSFGDESWAKPTGRLSAGARILLDKQMKVLIVYVSSIDDQAGKRSATMQADNEMNARI